MTLENLKGILDQFRKMPSYIPEEATIKGYANQSQVIGVDATVALILSTNVWKAALPHLQFAINNIPEDQNAEIYTQFVNAAELLWPNFISTIANSTRKKAHVMGVLKLIVKEIRDAPSN